MESLKQSHSREPIVMGTMWEGFWQIVGFLEAVVYNGVLLQGYIISAPGCQMKTQR